MTTLPPDWKRHLELALVPGLGPKLTAALLEHFGSADAALHASAAQLEAVPKIGALLAQQFAASFRTVDASAELASLQKHAVQIALLGREPYPTRLATIDDAPQLLYYRGTFDDADRNAVGIVGSRQCTPYGRRMAERIAAGLVRAGWTVISGLARGIDGVAHQAALDAGGRTIAVLAGGLSRIYPPEHAELADAIALRGALLTETPMTVAPQPGMFPARNRIISALSRGIVVIEANARSGALITATHAGEQGHEVFALPGNVDSGPSAGCHELLRKGARLVRDADDILEDLRGIAPPDLPPKARRVAPPERTLFGAAEPVAAARASEIATPVRPPGLDELQIRIWEALTEARHSDELARELALPSGELTRALMMLEMKKAIRRLPGNSYERR